MGIMARSGSFRLSQVMLGGAVWGMDIKEKLNDKYIKF